MAEKLMYIHNDDAQNYLFWTLQLAVDPFGHSTSWTNQFKFYENPQIC